jgi:tetratricopeptide (TPR) repeat protein
MKKAIGLLVFVLLFAVWPAYGQTPTTAAGYYNRGFARRTKGDLDGAIADYTKSLEINPSDPDPYNALAVGH